MPTPKQKAWYWREWAAVVAECKRAGIQVPDRHELHRRALGHDSSMLELDNHELDLVIAEFRSWSQPDDLQAQLLPAAQQRKRKMWKLNQLLGELAVLLQQDGNESEKTKSARANRYLWAILRDKYGNRPPEDLRDAELSLLLVDLTRAISRRRESVDEPF
ncbi:MAG: hypothetical protein N3J91_07030 [Verrucomicrobiae bacterium]|nr:hypothetical protein [Verrucomicrobiae bacterium]